MQNDFTDLLESARIDQRISKAGKPYFMLVLDLGRGIEFQYLCTQGENNVVAALLEATKK